MTQQKEIEEAYEDFKNYTSGTGLTVKNFLESYLSLLKKMDGIEDVVCNACNDCIDKTGGCAMLSNIFKAIKSHLTK